MLEIPLHDEIEQRFGVLPNFFRLTSNTPFVTENLWGFAKFAYLDSSMPSLFKERLFVYLSRFCEVRYCIARHIGFLVGLGYPSGDRDCLPQTVEQVLPLLQRSLPHGEELDSEIARCAAFDPDRFEFPPPDTVEEKAIFACATHAFLQTPDATSAIAALQQGLGAARLELLNVFLAFVRMAHYWTKIHLELRFEEDINHLLATQVALANCLFNDPEVEDSALNRQILEELAELRQFKEEHESLQQAYETVSRKNEQLLIERQQLQRVEENLRDSEEQLRLFVTASSDIVYKMSADWSEMRRLEGKNFLASTENSSGTWLEQYLPTEEQPQVIAAIQAAIRTKSPFELEHRIIQRDGTVGWTFSRAIPLLNAQQEIVEWFGAASDITDRKQAEELLRLSEQRLKLALKTGKLGSWQLDMKTNELFTSEQCKINYGVLPDADFSHQVLFDRIHPDDQARVEAAVQQAIVQHSEYDVEYRTVWDDGTVHWALVRGTVIYDTDETPLCMVGMSLDITDRKQIEERLAADLIEQRQTEAERKLILQREQAARKEAERANHIKDEFLAVLSHELRSPLNPILGWAKLLQRGNLNPERTTSALEIIERNAQLQSQLISDLLDISRILQGKLSLDQKPVDLKMVITSALETVRLAAEAKSLHIETTFSPDFRTVSGDAGRLQQVAWNLLSNAVKFTPQNGQIKVALTQTDTHAHIQVTDTGIGISPEFLPYVFEHFRQQDGATTRKFGGLGLGLAIARQIVEMHGGTIAVNSQGEGQGSTFTVQIPLAPRLSERPSTELPSDSVEYLTGSRILVVDDETDSREFVAFVLEQAGAIVTNVTSGIEALQVIGQGVPDLIISDIGMPEMDGYMLMQQIRALPQGMQIPAIALTAFAGELDQQLARASGFQCHLAKPVSPTEIIAVVAHLCGHSGLLSA